MALSADLSAAEFVQLVARRIRAGRPLAGLGELLAHAVTAANMYCPPSRRAGLRQQLAAAALAGADSAEAGSATQHALAIGFAAAADDQGQLDTMRSWLADGPALSNGVHVDPEVHSKILQTMSVYGQAAESDLDAYARADPVSGDAVRATCRPLRPEVAAKETAWTAALVDGQPGRLALAHVQGIWVPG